MTDVSADVVEKKLHRIFVSLVPARLRLLLVALEARLDGTLARSEIEEFCARAEGLAPGSDILMEPVVSFQGLESPLVVVSFHRPGGTWEVVFMVLEPLVPVVQGEVERQFGPIPVRVL
jgi:hypothetical protein